MIADNYQRLREIITDELSVDPDLITPTAKLVDDLGLDSLDIIDLIQRVEEEIQVEIQDHMIENLLSINALVEFMGTHRVVQDTSA